MKTERKKSGLITLIAIVVAVAGYLVYKYAYLVYREYDYFAYYDDIHGLQRANPVMISGVRVGEVSDIDINGNNKVKVTLSINKKVEVSKGSVALLASNGILGEKMILLEPGPGPGKYTHLDVITGMYDTSVMDMKDQVAPMIESAQYILNTADKNFSAFNVKIKNGLVEETQKNILSMENSMRGYQKGAAQISASAQKVTDAIGRFRVQTTNMVGNTGKLNASIKNAEESTEKFAAQPLSETVDTLRATVRTVRQRAGELEDNKDVKKALSDDKAYKDVSKQLKDAGKSIEELKEDPPGMTLIGGGK